MDLSEILMVSIVILFIIGVQHSQTNRLYKEINILKKEIVQLKNCTCSCLCCLEDEEMVK